MTTQGWWAAVGDSDKHESTNGGRRRRWWRALRSISPFFSFFLFSLFTSLFHMCLCSVNAELNREGISLHSTKTLGEHLTRDVVTYGVIGSLRTTDAVTYDVIKSLSKAIKMSHISRGYLPHLGKGVTSHDAMQLGIVITLSEYFK